MYYKILFTSYWCDEIINQTTLSTFTKIQHAYSAAKSIAEALHFKENGNHEELVEGRNYYWLEIMPDDYERRIEIVPVKNKNLQWLDQ